MLAPNQPVAAGFVDPSRDSQTVFRALLDAMSRPGLRVPCPLDLRPPAPLASATAAIALCLCDHDTPVWLDAAFATPTVAAFLRFHIAAPLTDEPTGAAFALIGDPGRMPELGRFAAGSALDPEHSATLVIQLPSLTDGAPVEIAGPGIERHATVRFAGLADGFWRWWDDNHARFPRGVDLILTDGRDIAALPRTARRVPGRA
jgi:alpha-D-ribose 1-methylphosphonate 5-triphosphate synthase subunit PhnH